MMTFGAKYLNDIWGFGRRIEHNPRKAIKHHVTYLYSQGQKSSEFNYGDRIEQRPRKLLSP
jgi:hypothetical protein